jgi:hypothetical protein
VTPLELFGGGLAELAINEIAYDSASDRTTLTWDSRGKVLYSIDYSTDLEFWSEVTDNVESQGETTSVTLPPLEGAAKAFFRVRKVD